MEAVTQSLKAKAHLLDAYDHNKLQWCAEEQEWKPIILMRMSDFLDPKCVIRKKPEPKYTSLCLLHFSNKYGEPDCIVCRDKAEAQHITTSKDLNWFSFQRITYKIQDQRYSVEEVTEWKERTDAENEE